MAGTYERVTTKDHMGKVWTRTIEVTHEDERFVYGRVVNKRGEWTGTSNLIDRTCITNRTPLEMDLKYGELVMP